MGHNLLAKFPASSDTTYMNAGLKERVAERLQALGKGAVAVATAAGLERTYIRDIITGKKKTVTVDKLPLLAKALGTTVEYLTLASDEPGEIPAQAPLPPPNTDLSKAEDIPNFRPFGGVRDVPEYGAAAGGKRGDADFRFNGQTVDMAPRPPGIANKKDVYALRVTGESMSPKYEEGERIYVDPHRSPAIMDYVVVELHSSEEGEPGDGFIKRLVRRTPTKFVVSQFNPPKELEFDRDEVKSLHRVIPTDELLGI